MDSASPNADIFSLTLDDFSGPLDLLCSLVESRAVDASGIKLTDVLMQYMTYLVSTGRSTLSELAEFFGMASRLLLGKIRSLMPREAGEDDAADEEPSCDAYDDDIASGDTDEETLAAMLERFRPYRAAAAALASMQAERERSFTREGAEGAPWFDIGDLYGLSRHWWSLIEDHMRSRRPSTEEGFWEEIPDAVPEEVLVDTRMMEIRELLDVERTASLSSLLERYGRDGLIVTLLALLELSRLGHIDLVQSDEWGDVDIAAA